MVLMLAALGLNTSGVMQSLVTALGLGLAILFGVSFVRGTLRINLQSFFRMTTVILMVVTLQLAITGLHELSENQIIWSSPREMALVGPIVRNDAFFFVSILALAATMLLMEWRRRQRSGYAEPSGRRAPQGKVVRAARALVDSRFLFRRRLVHVDHHRRIYLREIRDRSLGGGAAHGGRRRGADSREHGQ